MPLRITPFSPLANASRTTIRASREIKTLAFSNSDTQPRIKTLPFSRALVQFHPKLYGRPRPRLR